MEIEYRLMTLKMKLIDKFFDKYNVRRWCKVSVFVSWVAAILNVGFIWSFFTVVKTVKYVVISKTKKMFLYNNKGMEKSFLP